MLNELKKIVGEENVAEDANTKLVYSSDASMMKGNALVIVWPESVEQVQEVIQFAKTKFVDVVPRGAGTGLVGGAVPQRSIVLNLSKMNKVLKIGKKSALVQAGIVLEDLNNLLQLNKVFFPVIPASHKVCTIGGMIACNAAGKRAVHYGKTEDWVEYLEVVDGNGRVRRVNDVRKFCGSEGIYGVIVRAELKLASQPKKTTLEVYYYDGVTELMEKVSELKKNSHLLSLELLDPLTSSFLNLDKRYHLIAEYDNNKGSVKTEEEIIKWDDLRDAAYTICSQRGYTRIQDPCFKEEEGLREFMAYLKSINTPFFGHVGYGVLHPCFKEDADLKNFYEKVLKLGGSVTGEHGVGLLKKKYLSESEKKRIEMHKKVLDNTNIMNRGKII